MYAKETHKKGCKVWMLCDKSGFCLKFDIHTGKSKDQLVEQNLGSKVVNNLIVDLEQKKIECFLITFLTAWNEMESIYLTLKSTSSFKEAKLIGMQMIQNCLQ